MTNQVENCSFTVNPEVVASFHDQGIVILHAGKARLFSSNRTGARVWRAVEQELSLEAIVDEISARYHIARAAAHEHMARFLAELERHALIQRGGAS